MYTHSVAVACLDRVRQLLGYERINLYGNSYGNSLWSQHYARRFRSPREP
jgi:pimeloyl-ACP methyl ester carboxylesterase